MKIVAVKTKLFKTESITEKNVVEAVRHINQTLLEDHKVIQVLQEELAARDVKLLNEVHDLKEVTYQGFQEVTASIDGLRQEMKTEIGGLRQEMKTELATQTELLKQIAENTKPR